MYTDIKLFEDACKDQGIDPVAIMPDFSMLPTGLGNFLRSGLRLAIVNVSINKDEDGKEWKPNWSDEDEYKYFPWMDVEADDEKPSGSGLSFRVTGYAYSVTTVASRLMCRDRERAKYIFEQFKSDWENYILYRE